MAVLKDIQRENFPLELDVAFERFIPAKCFWRNCEYLCPQGFELWWKQLRSLA